MRSSVTAVPAISPFQLSRDSIKSNWPIWLISLLTFASGLFGILQPLLIRFSHHPTIFNLLLPFGLHHWTRSLTLVVGSYLIYLTFQLLHRKRAAWGLAILASALGIFGHIGRGQHWYAAFLPAATLVLLAIFRKRFTVRTEPSSILTGFLVAIGGIAFVVAYGTFGFWMLDRSDFGVRFSFGDSFIKTIRQLSYFGSPELVTHTRHADWFLDSIDILGIACGSFAAFSFFRPVAYRFRTLPQERALAKKILEKYGTSSNDYFKLWHDKSYFFSKSQNSVIAYRTAFSVAVCFGDPAGPEDELKGLISDFLGFCSRNGWAVAFHQTLPDLIHMYHDLGLQSLKIGEEGIVHLEEFNSTVKETKKFRYIRRKFEQEKYSFEVRNPPHNSSLMKEVQSVSDEWLTVPGRRERGFTMGRFEHDYIASSTLFIVRDTSGSVVAFANHIPSFKRGEATIDLMRHRADAPNGVMDYLFLELFDTFYKQGYKTFDLGLAPFASTGDKPGASIEERALHQIFEHLNRFFSYKGLHSYKAKFQPEWEARFLVYQTGVPGLLRTGLALTKVTESQK